MSSSALRELGDLRKLHVSALWRLRDICTDLLKACQDKALVDAIAEIDAVLLVKEPKKQKHSEGTR